jgi:hypothetical protein
MIPGKKYTVIRKKKLITHIEKIIAHELKNREIGLFRENHFSVDFLNISISFTHQLHMSRAKKKQYLSDYLKKIRSESN